MKKTFKLAKYSYLGLRKPLYLCLAAMALVECLLALFYIQRSSSFASLPYEQIIQNAGCPVVFGLALLLIILRFSLQFENLSKAPKSLYTLLCLPGPRWPLFAALALVLFFCLLLFWALQVLLLFLLYTPVMAYAQKQFAYYPEALSVWRNNGLFLAFVRGDFFRALMPLRFYGFISLFSGLLSFCGLFCSLLLNDLSNRSKNKRAIFVAAFAIWFFLFLQGIHFSRSGFSPSDSYSTLIYWLITVLLSPCLSFYCSYKSILSL